MNKIVKLAYVKRENIDSYISPSIRVSVGDVYLPFLTLVRVGKEYFVCTHEKFSLPIPKKLIGKTTGNQHNGRLVFNRVTSDKWEILLDAIKKHEEHSGYHINPHSFVVAWCLSNDLDLYKEEILSL